MNVCVHTFSILAATIDVFLREQTVKMSLREREKDNDLDKGRQGQKFRERSRDNNSRKRRIYIK